MGGAHGSRAQVRLEQVLPVGSSSSPLGHAVECRKRTGLQLSEVILVILFLCKREERSLRQQECNNPGQLAGTNHSNNVRTVHLVSLIICHTKYTHRLKFPLDKSIC